MGVTALGTALAVLLALGFYPFLLLPLLIIIHLSIVTVGQDFLSFGWEMFFLEISYNVFFLSLTHKPNIFIWISLNLLIFRFHLQAGASKLQSGDPNWRNLMALCYHYQTQPIPNMIAWYFHKLPVWFHKFSVAMMLFVEIIVPFAIFGTEEMRLAAFILLFLLQLFIWVSGNYSYFNHLTMVLVLLLVSDTYLEPLFGMADSRPTSPWLLQVFVSIVGIIFITLQLLQLWNHFFRNATVGRILYKIYPYHLANRYGIFAIMTTTRYEISVEGSDDGQIWKEYLFPYKPSELNRRPRQISPYQPRLDWQAWFLPFDYFENAVWFQNFLYRLLEGSPHVLALLRHNPFPDMPPRFIRARMYVYEFSDATTKKRLGYWWVRSFVREYSPVVTKEEVTH